MFRKNRTPTAAPPTPAEPPAGPPPSESDVEAARYLADTYKHLQEELGKVIVGQERVVEEILIAIFARGHCVMQGVPGLAKTLLVSTIAQAMELTFHRIQFTPDLMPSDITGTDILQEDPETGRRRFEFKDRKSTRLNSSHSQISYAVFCLKKKKKKTHTRQQT